jgi:hypothetical protein
MGQAPAPAPDAPNAPRPPANAKAPRKKLGKTGIEVPILCLGCCQTLDSKYDKRLHRAYQAGIDWFDTAEMYDNYNSHKTLAPFIHQIGDRKKLILTTKAFIKKDEATADGFKQAIEKCLRELETDYLDGFFIHMAHDERYLDPEFIKMADEMKKSGKIRFFGISTHDGSVVRMMTKAALGGVDAMMFRYNFREYGNLELNKAIDGAKKAGMGLIAMKTLASIPDDAEELKQFTSKNFTLIQAKLKAVWADERIDAIASQMGGVEHVQENVAAAVSPVKLSMEEFMQLHRLAANTCGWYCAGCTHHCESRIDQPVRVADTLRYLMYHECYGECAEAKRLYAALRPEERALDGVDFGAAAAACPQSIDLAARLAHAQRVLSA